MTTILLPASTLWLREVVRFLRQRNRVIGAVVSPLLFWLLIGSGVGTSFRPDGASIEGGFLTYVFPGTLALVVLFTAIFATISIIEDRREGFLQSVLVAPVPRSGIVLGKIAGGATLAVGQALIFLPLLLFFDIPLDPLRILALVALLGLMGFALTGLGFALAWRMQSIQGFHAIMNLLLLPMWVLSGALFPPSGAATWVQWMIRLNPLSYGVAGTRRLLLPEDVVAGLPSLPVAFLVSAAFAVATFLLALAASRGHTAGDLR